MSKMNSFNNISKALYTSFLTLVLVVCSLAPSLGQGKKALETAKDYEHKAQVAYERGDVADAFSYYNYALWTLKEEYKGDKELTKEYIRCLLKVSTVAFEIGQLDDAKSSLVEAREVGEANYHKHDPMLGNVYKRVGDMYLEEGDCNQALDFYEMSYKIYHKFSNEYPGELAGVIYKKAYILNHYKHEMDKAYKECLRAIDLGVKESKNNPDLGDYFSECGLIEFVRGNFDDSYNFFLNALAIKERHLGHDDKEVGKAYEEFGAVNWELHRYDSAMYYYEQARGIYDHVYPNVHSHIEAAEFNDHPLVYVEVDEDSTQHHDCMKKDLDIDNISLQNRNRRVARIYTSIGESYAHLNSYDLAIDSYGKAVDIYEEVFPGGNEEVADAYEKMAESYDLNGDREKAKSTYSACADMREATLGPDHPKTRKARNNANKVPSSRDN